MAKSFDKELLDKAVDYIQSTYSFEEILEKYNLLDQTKPNGFRELTMCCPLGIHDDRTPSFNINVENKKFHCLSCGTGGGIIDFIVSYETNALERRTKFTEVVERLLSNDPIMQLRVGSRTIMKKQKDLVSFEEINIRRSVRFKEVSPSPKTFPELSRKLKAKFSGNVDLLLTAIDCKEKGMSPEEIYNILWDSVNPKSEKGISLSSFDIKDFIEDFNDQGE